jgi:hypothetical protein
MHHLDTEVRSVTSLSEGVINEMYCLYEQYYAASSIEHFRQDLEEKQYVIVLQDNNLVLRGFSTVALIDYNFNNQRQRAIYSGDTVIHHDYWGSQSLPLAWAHLAGSLKSENPSVPLYWLLIVKGHRTYRYLTLFSRRYYPSWRMNTPKETQDLMDYLAQQKFGDAYCHEKGIVRFERSHGHLREVWASTPEYLLNKPHVRYFLDRNPGFHRGDELVCLTELHEDNLRSHVLRAFTDALQNE